MVSVWAICSMLFLGFSVSECVKSSRMGGCFFFNFLLFRIICVRYLIAIWGRDFIS